MCTAATTALTIGCSNGTIGATSLPGDLAWIEIDLDRRRWGQPATATPSTDGDKASKHVTIDVRLAADIVAHGWTVHAPTVVYLCCTVHVCHHHQFHSIRPCKRLWKSTSYRRACIGACRRLPRPPVTFAVTRVRTAGLSLARQPEMVRARTGSTALGRSF